VLLASLAGEVNIHLPAARPVASILPPARLCCVPTRCSASARCRVVLKPRRVQHWVTHRGQTPWLDPQPALPRAAMPVPAAPAQPDLPRWPDEQEPYRGEPEPRQEPGLSILPGGKRLSAPGTACCWSCSALALRPRKPLFSAEEAAEFLISTSPSAADGAGSPRDLPKFPRGVWDRAGSS